MVNTQRMAVLVFACHILSGAVPYTAPTGDIDRDGSVDVTDLQCLVLVYQAVIAAGPLVADVCDTDLDCQVVFGPETTCRPGLDKHRLCLPGCLHPQVSVGADPGVLCTDPDANDASCLGLVQKHRVDLNCDGQLTNQDFLYHVAIIMGAIGGPGTAHVDGDGRMNFCDDDSDGDGDLDVVDCALLDATVGPTQPELCNGLDENCNGKIDEYLGEISCGVSICEHNEPACVDGAPAVCDPFLGALAEACNGVDDDCNGKIDDDTDVALCAGDGLPPNGAMVSCIGGQCAVTACLPGWVDVNEVLGDGCECAEDPAETVNATCSGATQLGTFADAGNGSLTLAVGNEPSGNEDWYRFHAQDVDEGTTDSFHVRIKFVVNPDDAFVFDVHYGSCAQSKQICTGASDMEWFTDFSTPSATAPPPTLPGPGINGGGEASCRADAAHKATPTNYADDTTPSSHQCVNNSVEFFLRVYRLPGTKPPCQSYKLEITNGVY
ncbi:MAG: MopE-related protein [Pseudomonadota bacterium]